MSFFNHVANTHLPDNDDVVLVWNTETSTLYTTSEMDPSVDRCIYKDVRKTIYWAMGESPRTCRIPIMIRDLVRYHTELKTDGLVKEYCSAEHCSELLAGTWDSLIQNKIYVFFTVSILD